MGSDVMSATAITSACYLFLVRRQSNVSQLVISQPAL